MSYFPHVNGSILVIKIKDQILHSFLPVTQTPFSCTTVWLTSLQAAPGQTQEQKHKTEIQPGHCEMLQSLCKASGCHTMLSGERDGCFYPLFSLHPPHTFLPHSLFRWSFLYRTQLILNRIPKSVMGYTSPILLIQLSKIDLQQFLQMLSVKNYDSSIRTTCRDHASRNTNIAVALYLGIIKYIVFVVFAE